MADAEYYRKQAQSMREDAERTRHPEIKRRMILVAQEYDKLAETVAEAIKIERRN